jgi:ribosomal protein S18 acetylase RimI-like enzyme
MKSCNDPLSIKTRRSTLNDYSFCYLLAKSNMYNLVVKHWKSWNPKLYRKSFDISNTRIVLNKNKRIGFFRIRKEPSLIYLMDMQVSKKMQGKGIGKYILELIESKANKNNLKKIQLSVFKDNSAKDFYKKLGFKIKKTKKDVFIMEKEL